MSVSRRAAVTAAMGAALALLTVVNADALLPPQGEVVIGNAVSDPFAWRIWVSYVPRSSEVRVFVTMDDLRQWERVTLRVSSSEPWMPSWEGTIAEGHGDRAGLGYPAVRSPEPMDAARAKRLARSFTVYLDGEDEEGNPRRRVVSFAEAYFRRPAEPLAWLESVRSRLRGDLLLAT